MKKLINVLALAALFSCSAKEENTNILENLSYTVDTVVVDAGEDFLRLPYSLGVPLLSQDKNRLYFFERDPPKLVEVDLQQLKVLKKTEFDVEGPDGVGSYLGGKELGPEGHLFLQSYAGTGLFDQNGKKIRDLKFIPAGIDTDLAQNYPGLYANAIYDFGTRKIYTQPHIESAGEYGLFILDPDNNMAKSLPIPKMKIVDDYSGTAIVKSGTSTTHYYFGQQRFTTRLPGELILSASTMSGLYRFQIETESLEFIDIQHKTVPNAMEFIINKNPTDEAAVVENRVKLAEHLNYKEIIWYETREMFFRFGVKTFHGEKKGDPDTYELYLFAYDEDFNVLGETKLDQLTSAPRSSFFKDGKLWSYVNVDDELGFAVMTFDF